MHSFVGTSFEAGETRDGVDHTITLDASGVDYATDSAALDGVALGSMPSEVVNNKKED